MEVNKKNRIYLTGFMGSGKSTLTPILANTIGYNSIDLDSEIEKKTGKRITKIFSEMGEEYFRELERSTLREISLLEGYVISLGGGTILDPVNLSLIKSTGLLVYIKLSPDEIFRRMKNKTDRPILHISEESDKKDELLRTKIIELLEKREPVYNQADIIISSDWKRVGKTVDDIVRKLNQYIK